MSNLFGGGSSGPWDGSVADPFNDQASKLMPRTIVDALRWSQSVAMLDGTYRSAMKWVGSFFVTDIQIQALDEGSDKTLPLAEKAKYEKYLRKTLKIQSVLNNVSDDFLLMGVSVTSVLMPTTRRLSCPHCGMAGGDWPFRTVAEDPAFAFRFENFRFVATCVRCKRRGEMNSREVLCKDESKVFVKRWSPHEIAIDYDEYSGHRQYVWKIPASYREAIRSGSALHLDQCRDGVIEAIKDGKDFLLDEDQVYAMINEPMAGVQTQGWGLSDGIVNLRQGWHCQMLRRTNEAICSEYLLPMRVISPAASGADPASDPVLGTNLGGFKANMHRMIRGHRRDPGEIMVSPHALQYQMLGGEANQLAPFQLIDQATDNFLNASGVPAELYKGTLSVQAAPVSIRLFENRWSQLVIDLNGFLDFVVDRIGKLLKWEPVDCQLQKSRLADDMNRQMAMLQLMMGGQISQHTGLKALGLSFPEEQTNLVDEQRFVAQKQQVLADEMAGKAEMGQMAGAIVGPGGQLSAGGGGQGGPPQGGQPQQGGPPPGGPQGGPPPGPQGQSDPETINDQAQQIAAGLQGQPEAQRRSELLQIKQQDPVLHSVVKGFLEQGDRQLDQQGGQQLRQQLYGKSAARLPTLREVAARLAAKRA